MVVMGDGVNPLAAIITETRDAVLHDGHDLVLLSRYLDPGHSASIPLRYRVYASGSRIAATCRSSAATPGRSSGSCSPR